MRVWAETKVNWRGVSFDFQPLTFSASFNKGNRWFIVSCPAYFILQIKDAMITNYSNVWAPCQSLNVHCCTKLNRMRIRWEPDEKQKMDIERGSGNEERGVSNCLKCIKVFSHTFKLSFKLKIIFSLRFTCFV